MSWLRERGYAGSIVWAIENDDFDGKSCGKHKYPLMRIIGGCLIDNEGWVQMCATTVERGGKG